jgi:hypothetical protein
MVGSSTREARGRVHRGCLLGEGAADKGEVGLKKSAKKAPVQTDP